MNREEERIRIIAYHIWEQEGCYCHGNDVQHWLKAEIIWHGMNKPLKTEGELIPSERYQQINTAGNTKPVAVLSAQQNKKDQFPKRKP